MDDQSFVTIGFLREALAAILGEHKKQLSSRIDALESRRLLAWAGPHDVSKPYLAGDVVQRSGALYVALVGTSETPGSSSCWRELTRARP